MTTSDDSLPYFAYGSNLNPNQMNSRCPGHRVLARARLVGHAVRFAGEGQDWHGAVATVEPFANSTVYGVLFALTPAHYAALDAYEGCDDSATERALYERVVRSVELEDGRAIDAYVYLMVPAEEGLPSRIYRDAIVEGMRHHGLAPEAIGAMTRVQVADEP